MTGTQALGQRLADDPEAVRECYAALGPMVLAYLRRLVPRDDAEDVLQQVFLDVWRTRTSYDPTRRLEPWVLTIAHRRAVDHLRRSSRDHSEPVAVLPSHEDSDAEQFADRYVESAVVRDAMRALPDEQRETLALAYFGDLTQTQIAGQLGVPLGTVKARSFRGLRSLAAVLIPEEDEQ